MHSDLIVCYNANDFIEGVCRAGMFRRIREDMSTMADEIDPVEIPVIVLILMQKSCEKFRLIFQNQATSIVASIDCTLLQNNVFQSLDTH